MSTIDIRPVSGSLGAEIFGIDLTETISDALSQRLEQALLDHLVIFFPDQKLSPDQHVDFAGVFGKPFTDHPAYLPIVPGYPAVVELSGHQGGRADLWHSDVTISPT